MRQPVAPITLLVLTLTLLSIGLVMVYSASGARAGWEQRRLVRSIDAEIVDEYSHHSPAYFERQVVWAVAGVLLLALLVAVDVQWLYRATPWVAGFMLLLLLMVLLTPLGVTAKGATRWLRLGPIVIQPSEFAKPVLVLLMARLLSIKRENVRQLFRGFIPLVLTSAVFLGLILAQRDLGTVLVLGLVVVGMWLLARLRAVHLAGVAVAAVPVLVWALFAQRYRIERIMAMFDLEKHASTTGYQLSQSLISVGSGGLTGTGLGMGLQKYMFLSESHTDFIFAILCEELGFLGAAGGGGSVFVLGAAWAAHRSARHGLFQLSDRRRNDAGGRHLGVCEFSRGTGPGAHQGPGSSLHQLWRFRIAGRHDLHRHCIENRQ
jgi:cell division protein FtsW